jgi:signal transduction histidine kinase
MSVSRTASVLALAILVLAGVHYLVPRPDKQIHNFMYHFAFIPILMAGMLLSWRAALVATLATTLAEFPLLWKLFQHDVVYMADQAGETAVFGIAGVVVGVIAERARRTTQELAQNMEKLRRAERLSAVAQLSASLAHEIRNPLAGISGAAGILKRGNANPDNVQACLEIIDKESQRLNKLLTNFLEFARPRTPRMQPTDLASVIDSVLRLAQSSHETRMVTFDRSIAPNLPEVACDSEQIKQVLLNLVINAAQATGSGVVNLRVWSDSGCAWIAVRDSGTGIPPEQQDRIFEPFFTTKENGTGLGLAIAAKIMEQHGGHLTANNVPGKGLTMLMQLPVRANGATA